MLRPLEYNNQQVCGVHLVVFIFVHNAGQCPFVQSLLMRVGALELTASVHLNGEISKAVRIIKHLSALLFANDRVALFEILHINLERFLHLCVAQGLTPMSSLVHQFRTLHLCRGV
jgi:hypothetical protein